MLQNLGLQFEVLPADVDESVTPGITPPDLVSSLALSKAQRVEEIVKERQQNSEDDILIIAADTVVALGMDILASPPVARMLSIHSPPCPANPIKYLPVYVICTLTKI